MYVTNLEIHRPNMDFFSLLFLFTFVSSQFRLIGRPRERDADTEQKGEQTNRQINIHIYMHV